MSRLPFNPDAALGAVPAQERPAEGPLTVSDVTRLVKRAIERNLPRTLSVVGQLSNFKRHTSGHLYFTLKDEASELSGVMWRSDASGLKFTPVDGLEVIATGCVEVFERAGRYQLYARRLEPRGVGALELAFRQMREKLERAGLFDAARKRRLPKFPRRIALVTSPTGAAIRDILQTLARRYPCLEVCIRGVRVQGPGAAEEIAAAIGEVNARAAQLGGIDALIVGRGGGSLEDLWAFNEEVVARAIFASAIPVISAVGHEVDVTIADLVADVRAATPTAAAELVVPVLDEVLAELADHAIALRRAAVHRVQVLDGRLAGVRQRDVLRDPMVLVRRREQATDETAARLGNVVVDRVHKAHRRLSRCELALARIEPRRFLLRRAQEVAQRAHRLDRAIDRRLTAAERRLVNPQRQLDRAAPLVRLPMLAAAVTRLEQRFRTGSEHRLRLALAGVGAVQGKLEAMSYRTTLQRGYSITRRKPDRAIVRDPAAVSDGDVLMTETGAGSIESRVINRQQRELFD